MYCDGTKVKFSFINFILEVEVEHSYTCASLKQVLSIFLIANCFLNYFITKKTLRGSKVEPEILIL